MKRSQIEIMAATAVVIAAITTCGPAKPQTVKKSSSDDTWVQKVDSLATASAAADKFAGVVLIARNNTPILDKAYGLADREQRRQASVSTRYDIASLGKMFTGVAIAQLVARGLVSFDDPVGEHLTDFPNDAIAKKVTIHQLLTHTSGVPDLPDSLFNHPPATLNGYLSYFAKAKLDFEPGSDHAYSNAGFILLGLIVEKVSGKPFQEYVHDKVFSPAGMSSVSYQRDDVKFDTAIGYAKSEDIAWKPNTGAIAAFGGPHGGALSTASDLMRFFTALRSGKLVKGPIAETATTPRAGESTGYGFGVLPFDTDRLVGHSGGNVGMSADAYTYWRSGYTIIVLSNLDPPASHDVALQARRLLEPRFSNAAH